MDYDTRTAAARLNVCKETVIRWCRAGRFPGAYIHLGSRKFGWRIPEAAIRALQGPARAGEGE